MRIFALETNKNTLHKTLLAPGERILHRTTFHWIRYMGGVLRFVLLTAVAGALEFGRSFLLLPSYATWVIVVFWVIFAAWPFLNRLIDWWHDAVIVTTEEVIIINQTTIFHRKIRQMSLENLASVSDQTQWGNIFGFGKLLFDLKEGTGQHITLAFVPKAHLVASIISDANVAFHRREIEQPNSAA